MLLLLLLLLSWQVRATKNSFQSEVTKEREKIDALPDGNSPATRRKKGRIRKKVKGRKLKERK